MSIKSVSKVMAAIAGADTAFTWESEDAFKVAEKFIEMVEDCAPESVLEVLEKNVPNNEDDWEDCYDDEEKLLLEDEEDDDYGYDYVTRTMNPDDKVVTVPKDLMRDLKDEYPEAKQFFMYEDPYTDANEFFILPADWHLDEDTKRELSPKKTKFRKLHTGEPLENQFSIKTRSNGTTDLYVKRAGVEEYGLPFDVDFWSDDNIRGIKVRFND